MEHMERPIPLRLIHVPDFLQFLTCDTVTGWVRCVWHGLMEVLTLELELARICGICQWGLSDTCVFSYRNRGMMRGEEKLRQGEGWVQVKLVRDCPGSGLVRVRTRFTIFGAPPNRELDCSNTSCTHGAGKDAAKSRGEECDIIIWIWVLNYNTWWRSLSKRCIITWCWTVETTL